MPSRVGRPNAPVFVMGSPRSGTTLLYHMLLSAGDFAVYRTEAYVFNMLVPRFGNLSARKNREALLKVWLGSEKFRRSGLTPEEITARVHEGVRNGGDFLRVLMESICQKQGVRRWAECTPENVLYVHDIKRTIPEALLIHIVRDGRDVALSLEKMGWVRPLPIDRRRPVFVAGLFWGWLVDAGRRNGQAYPQDYLEVKYEDLIQQPRETLARIAQFIEHDLDYDRIQGAGVGSVSNPNTAFEAEAKQGAFQPVGRWKSSLSPGELTELEELIGKQLRAAGYPTEKESPNHWRDAAWRILYRTIFHAKHFLKTRTFLGRWLVDTKLLSEASYYDQDKIAERRAKA